MMNPGWLPSETITSSEKNRFHDLPDVLQKAFTAGKRKQQSSMAEQDVVEQVQGQDAIVGCGDDRKMEWSMERRRRHRLVRHVRVQILLSCFNTQ